jgi:hypothetical protein
MLRIEIDHLLRYVATGEDEALVLGALRQQADGEALLGQVRAALELLGPAGLGAAAAERLRQVERAVEGGGPPAAATRSTMFAARPIGAGSASERLLRSPAGASLWRSDLLPERGAKNPGPSADTPPGLAAAIRKGAAEAVRLGTAVLHKPFVKRDRGGPEAPARFSPADEGPDLPRTASLDISARMSVAERSADAFYLEADASEVPFFDTGEPPPDDDGPILRSGARFDAPGGATVELSCQTDAEGDRLRVALAGGRDAARPTLVTCIPAEGPITRATTDAAGTVVLPWPAPGAGVLRIDGHRTVEIALKVEL